MLHTFLIFMKKLCLWLYDLKYAKQNEGRKLYDISGVKSIHFLTASTLFQSNVSVSVFKVKIYILEKIKKFSIAVDLMLPEM